jgi:hypothetical protein
MKRDEDKGMNKDKNMNEYEKFRMSRNKITHYNITITYNQYQYTQQIKNNTITQQQQ